MDIEAAKWILTIVVKKINVEGDALLTVDVLHGGQPLSWDLMCTWKCISTSLKDINQWKCGPADMRTAQRAPLKLQPGHMISIFLQLWRMLQ
ncbi:hypothetical protein AAC387_Pa05g2637 [Persea americana]